jgi:hypothetical protein
VGDDVVDIAAVNGNVAPGGMLAVTVPHPRRRGAQHR